MTIYFPKENDNSSAVPCGPYFKYSSDIFSSFSLPINSVISRKCQHGKQIQEIIIIASVPGAERSIPEAVYTFLYMRSVRCQCRLCIDCHNGNRMQCLLFQSCSINQEHTVPVFSLLFTVKFLQPVCNLRLPRIFVIPEMIHGNVGYGAVCIAVVPVMPSEDFLMSCMRCPVIVCIFCRKSCLLDGMPYADILCWLPLPVSRIPGLLPPHFLRTVHKNVADDTRGQKNPCL